MINLTAIKDPRSDLFEQCWQLYEDSFPAEERRERDYHIETMQRDAFRCDAIYDETTFVGILFWWEFEKIRYIEHFAILAELRSGGYGKRVLEFFNSQSTKRVLLEVEHPEDELATRRIGFYEREGFVLNPHAYCHPPYRGDAWVSLRIMTAPNAITEEELNDFKHNGFPLIHFRHDVD